MPTSTPLHDVALDMLADEFPQVPRHFRVAVLRAFVSRGLSVEVALPAARLRIIDACAQ